MESIKIRPAKPEDAPSILWMIQLLAECEHEPHALKIGEQELLRDGFGEEKFFHCIVAEVTSPLDVKPQVNTSESSDLPSQKMRRDEKLIGYALYYFNYSTWAGRVLYIEDLFVRSEYRNKGIGTALMRECGKVAVSKDCARMQWQVLDWNTKAMDLYERLGAKCMKEWLTIRMDKETLNNFAQGKTDTGDGTQA